MKEKYESKRHANGEPRARKPRQPKQPKEVKASNGEDEVVYTILEGFLFLLVIIRKRLFSVSD